MENSLNLGDTLSKQESVKCPICSSQEITKMYPSEIKNGDSVSFSYTFSPAHSKTFQVLRCSECTHVFCNPIPKDIASQYQDVVDDEYLKHRLSRTHSAEKVLALVKEFKKQGSWLDVGCATGDLLEVVGKSDFEAEGLELSNWSSAIAEKKGFVIRREFLSTLATNFSNSYDVVSLIGVIEHFDSPHTEMENIFKLLRPGGILVLWTGDVDSITSKVLGRKWWYWQGQHIQYFSHKSLIRLCESVGFFHRTTKIFPFSADQDTLKNSLRRYGFEKLLLSIIKPIFKLKSRWYLRIPGELLFVAQKPN